MYLFKDYGINISVKRYGQGCVELPDDSDEPTSCETNGVCPRSKKNSGSSKSKEKYYVRISCWTYNSSEDFEALNLVFGNNLKLSTSNSASLKHQFLHTFDLYERLFSTIDPLRHPRSW